MERIRVLVNVGAGAARAEDVPGRVRAACAAAGLAADVALVGAAELEALARAALGGPYAALVVGGGDGSLNAAAQILAGGPLPLGVLPLGTGNHFARDLGVPLHDLEAAARIVAAGRVREVDVAALGERVILNNSSIGLYPTLVRARGRHRASIRGLATTLVRFPRYRVRLRSHHGEHLLHTPFVFVGNNEYRPGLPPGRRARLDAGELFVCAATASRRHLLPLAARALRSLETPFVCFRAPEVTVELGKRRVWVAMDGEVRRLPTPLAYRIRPRALRVVAP